MSAAYNLFTNKYSSTISYDVYYMGGSLWSEGVHKLHLVTPWTIKLSHSLLQEVIHYYISREKPLET